MPSLQLFTKFQDLNLDNITSQKKNLDNNKLKKNNNNNEPNSLDLQLLVIII